MSKLFIKLVDDCNGHFNTQLLKERKPKYRLTNRHSDTHTHRQKYTYTQTHRLSTNRHTDKQKRHKDRNTFQHTIIEREKQTDGQTYRHTDTKNHRHTTFIDRELKTYRQTEKVIQTDIHYSAK
jgi:hypothetical protein